MGRLIFLLVLIGLMCASLRSKAADEPRIPHNQSKPPGPALSPQEAISKMQVPPGFQVELVASEPAIVNPVAMTFDERGRAWITESLEYPRLSSGPGRDRVKILEDTDGDGTMEKVTIFAEGLNIPSGIAVGHGGVWVANAPDILFLKDTDGDDRADSSQVVVTGFGRDDTHELPNSLTWGPDGWLYGLNGVFNRSSVKDPVSGKQLDFTCALFRINPRNHEFQLFCEGTSNPWGIAWNATGEAFVSACVIDHLWHLSETGYYHRQGGPYPPFTWKIESIVGYKHQQAAYCGITMFDSDAYPPEYRNRLMMGNIHGGCINVDTLQEHGATYQASPADDFLTANDAWFMPVVQKTGPDGCLWILDWYDRYHCYQDARRDSDGLDRMKGRLYRVRYKDTPNVGRFDLSKESSDELIRRLRAENVYIRETAQRLLAERNHPETNEALRQIVRNPEELLRTRLHALWALLGAGTLADDFLESLFRDPDADVRGWAVRAAGNQRTQSQSVHAALAKLARDVHPRVRLQAAIAVRKLELSCTIPVLTEVLVQAENDPLPPRIIWQNLHPLLEHSTAEFVSALESSLSDSALRPRNPSDSGTSFPAQVLEILPRTADRILAAEKPDTASVIHLVKVLLKTPSATDAADRCLRLLTERIRSGELSGKALENIRLSLSPALQQIWTSDVTAPLFVSSLELSASAEVPEAVIAAVGYVRTSESEDTRIRLLNAVITARAPESLTLARLLLQPELPVSLQQKAVQTLGRIPDALVSNTLMEALKSAPPEVHPSVLETISGRVDSSLAFMRTVASGQLPATMLNANQARRMLNMKHTELSELVQHHWGTVRSERDPSRAQLISQMRNTLRTVTGDVTSGQTIFRRVCGQCHKIYGQGAEVGPDITRNGRASFEQLLSNVFDPSLVIGAAYQAQTVITRDGRLLTGLLSEDSPRRVILKMPGDKQEVIAREEIEESVRSSLSLMPEGLEKQLQPQELADLFAFLILDRPPEDPNASYLSGAVLTAASAKDPKDFPALIDQLLPGFTTNQSGRDGVALIPEYHGRPAVSTHPISRDFPCELTASISIPKAENAKVVLRLSAASADDGDWRLIVRINRRERLRTVIGRTPDKPVWQNFDVEVTELAGQTATIELINAANNWSNEFAYWNAAELFIFPDAAPATK